MPALSTASDRAPTGRWQFWIDRGGTFTDVVGRRPDGTLATHKLLSDNPEHNRDADVAGLRQSVGRAHDRAAKARDVGRREEGETGEAH